MSHSHSDSHGQGLGHIVPASIFKKVFATLVFLTIVTVAVSLVDLGSMNIVVAMLVASCKALLVALFFMHLKYENPLTWVYAFFPILLLATLLGGVFIDNPMRHAPAPLSAPAK
ncbi:MAG: cytochrome C oxidase subunit IV family protein [Oligoflexia bacterium]|nr:cytochrome C oxidase subunit IV family protein [Oligoflexia bacterium]